MSVHVLLSTTPSRPATSGHPKSTLLHELERVHGQAYEAYQCAARVCRSAQPIALSVPLPIRAGTALGDFAPLHAPAALIFHIFEPSLTDLDLQIP